MILCDLGASPLRRMIDGRPANDIRLPVLSRPRSRAGENVVDALRSHDAIVVGKTNTPEFDIVGADMSHFDISEHLAREPEAEPAKYAAEEAAQVDQSPPSEETYGDQISNRVVDAIGDVNGGLRQHS